MVRALPLTLLVATLGSASLWGDSDPRSLPEMDLRFLDGSTARILLIQESVDLETRYGRLTIPCNEVRKIEFALRLEDGVEKRIEEAIQQLGSKEFQQRELAGKDLLNLAIPAYPFLKKNVSNKELEISRRCEALIKQIETAVPANRLQVRSNDLVQSREFTVTGRLTATKLKVRNKHFGETDLKVSELHSFSSTGAGYLGVTAPFVNETGVLRAAHLFEKGDFFAAKESAEVFAKEKQVEDLARQFRFRTKGGLGVGLKPGAIKPDGIESMFIQLEARTVEQLKTSLETFGDDLARACYITAAIAEAHRGHAPVKEKKDKKDPKDWENWSVTLRDTALDLAGAVQDKQPAKVKAALTKLNRTCSSCHEVFRDCN